MDTKELEQYGDEREFDPLLDELDDDYDEPHRDDFDPGIPKPGM